MIINSLIWSSKSYFLTGNLYEGSYKVSYEGLNNGLNEKPNDVLNTHDDIFPMIKVSLIFDLAESYHHY